jgi:hypothetical protein
MVQEQARFLIRAADFWSFFLQNLNFASEKPVLIS